MQKFLINFKKKLNLFTESYSFIRDLINTPANFLGPNEILTATKKISCEL